MNKGQKFESAMKEFLKLLLRDIFEGQNKGYTLSTEPTVQGTGTQYGRDITVEWSYEGANYYWWLECKNHNKTISKKEYADKILESLLKQKKPTCFCLVATFHGPCNWFRERKDELDKQKFRRPNIFFWPIEGPQGIKKALQCYPSAYEKIYKPEETYPNEEEKKNILSEIKKFIIINNEDGLRKLGKKRQKTSQMVSLQSPEKESFVSHEMIEEVDDISKQMDQI